MRKPKVQRLQVKGHKEASIRVPFSTPETVGQVFQPKERMTENSPLLVKQMGKLDPQPGTAISLGEKPLWYQNTWKLDVLNLKHNRP